MKDLAFMCFFFFLFLKCNVSLMLNFFSCSYFLFLSFYKFRSDRVNVSEVDVPCINHQGNCMLQISAAYLSGW